MVALSTNAQVKTKIFQTEVPAKILPKQSKIEVARKINAPLEFNNLKQKAKDNKLKESENKFALPVSVNIDFIKEAKESKEGEISTYSLAIKAEEALNLSVQFKEFWLSKNAILSIYTKNEITDSITAKENNENNIWATRVYQGNTLFVVLKLPADERKEVSLKINKVNLGYKPFGMDFGNIGASEPVCHINANCPDGNGWDNEKNSVAMIVANGEETCTGSLIMNACSNNIPYLLTANHCLDAGNVPNWVFQFQTWSTTCVGNVGWREDVQFNGCQLRANDAITDFALLQMNTTPAANSGIHYAGWSRQTTGITSTTVIHHPRGDLMKISRDNNAPVGVTFLGVDCWQLDLDLGRVERGSSGGAYFNQNHQIIGQHWRRPEAGTRPICDITVTLGGRFDRSWTGGGTNTTRLSNWLDPSNSNAMTTNTTNTNLLRPPVGTLYIAGNTGICSGTTSYTLNNNGNPFNGNISWTSSNPNIASITPTGNPVTLTQVSSGTVTITANACESSTTKTVHVGVPNINNFNFLVSGASCISYNNQSLSFGVGFNGNWGCQLKDLADITEVEWQVFCSNPHQVTYNAGTYTCQFPTQVNKAGLSVAFSYPTQPYVITLLYRVKNACGWSEWSPGNTHFIQACGGGWSFAASPNPTNGTVNVALDEPTIKNDKSSEIREIQVMDKFGKIMKQFKYNSGNKGTTINISELKADIYFIRVFNGKEWKGQSIIKN